MTTQNARSVALIMHRHTSMRRLINSMSLHILNWHEYAEQNDILPRLHYLESAFGAIILTNYFKFAIIVDQ